MLYLPLRVASRFYVAPRFYSFWFYAIAVSVAIFPALGVAQTATPTVRTFAWNAPTTNADGTTPVDLSGYEIGFGTSTRNYTTVTNIGNVLSKSITFPSYSTYFVSVRAFDAAGNRGAYSNELRIDVSRCDVNVDGVINIADVQRSVNQALILSVCNGDINGDQACDVKDVQRAQNAVASGVCNTGP